MKNKKIMLANNIAGSTYEEKIRDLSQEEWMEYCDDILDEDDCIEDRMDEE